MTLRFGQGWYTVFCPEDIPAYIMRVQGWGWSWAAGVHRLPGGSAWLSFVSVKSSLAVELLARLVLLSLLRLAQLWSSKRSQSFVQSGEICIHPAECCLQVSPKGGSLSSAQMPPCLQLFLPAALFGLSPATLFGLSCLQHPVCSLASAEVFTCCPTLVWRVSFF